MLKCKKSELLVMYQLYALCCPRQCINHRDCRREIILPTGTLLCFALMYAVATGANLNNLNPIDATVLGHDAGLRGLCDARRRHDPTGPLRHRHFRFYQCRKITRRSELRRAQVSMFYGCISAKATTCANTYGELAVPLKKKRE